MMDVDKNGCVLTPEEERMSMAHMVMVAWMSGSMASQHMTTQMVNVAMWQWFVLAKIGYGWGRNELTRIS